MTNDTNPTKYDMLRKIVAASYKQDLEKCERSGVPLDDYGIWMFGIEEETATDNDSPQIICYVEGKFKDALLKALSYKEYRESSFRTFQCLNVIKAPDGSGKLFSDKWSK